MRRDLVLLPRSTLQSIKMVHTMIWAVFAFFILAIPVGVWRGRSDLVLLFNGLVSVELVVLAFNRCKCPLTDLAAPYTSDRRANFDIYLPEWLARYNKEIFGSILVAGDLYALGRWLGWI